MCTNIYLPVTNKWRWKGIGVGKEEPTKNYVKHACYI